MERPEFRPGQGGLHPFRSECPSNVPPQRPDLRPTAAANVERELWIGVFDKIDGMHLNRPRLEVRDFTLSSHFIGSFPFHLQSRERRWQLLDAADEVGESRTNLSIGWHRWIDQLGHGPF